MQEQNARNGNRAFKRYFCSSSAEKERRGREGGRKKKGLDSWYKCTHTYVLRPADGFHVHNGRYRCGLNPLHRGENRSVCFSAPRGYRPATRCIYVHTYVATRTLTAPVPFAVSRTQSISRLCNVTASMEVPGNN